MPRKEDLRFPWGGKLPGPRLACLDDELVYYKIFFNYFQRHSTFDSLQHFQHFLHRPLVEPVIERCLHISFFAGGQVKVQRSAFFFCFGDI